MTPDLAQLEQQKADMLYSLAGWSEARLAFRPAPGCWSSAEMLDHIVKVETDILAAARLGFPTPHRIGLRDRLGYSFLEYIFKSDRRVKVPEAAPSVLPTPDPSCSAILDRWNQTRHKLARFVDHLSPAQRTAGIFRHPVSGWMDIGRILGFFSVHIVHHEFQLARLRTASESLASEGAAAGSTR